MLSEEERQRIAAEGERGGQGRAAVSEALMVVQESRGWVSDEAVADVAAALGLRLEEVEAVATAYELIYRKPVGKHVIMVCDSVSCWVTGQEAVLARLQDRLGVRLGETTRDGLFTLLPAGCLGACDEAPALMVDGELYGDLTPGRVDEILARHGVG